VITPEVADFIVIVIVIAGRVPGLDTARALDLPDLAAADHDRVRDRVADLKNHEANREAQRARQAVLTELADTAGQWDQEGYAKPVHRAARYTRNTR
jgi:hypothetical protein